MEITGSVMIYMLEVTYMLPKFHHTQVTCCQNFITQIGYISMHTRDVQQHKGTYFIPTANTSWITGSIQHVLAYFIIIAKSISSVTNISNLLHNMSYFIIITYFNTTVTTKRMANTKNVTFR